MPRVAGVTVGLRAEIAQFQADMRNAVGVTNRTVNEIKGAMGHLNTFLGAHLGLQAMDLTVGKIVQVGDAYTSLVGRLKNATTATGDFNRVYQQLYSISQKNGVALESSIATFQGLARAANEIGASSGQIVRVTDIVQKLGVISGASTEAMKNGMQQFTQAMNGSIVHAEEWNSIVENMPAVADGVAKGLGKSLGEVRQMVVKQKLSAEEMFNSLMKYGSEADRQFAAMPRTIAMAQAKMSNTFGKLVHDLDDATHATKRLATGMGDFADIVEKSSPKIVQMGRTVGAFMGVLEAEWKNAAIAAEMQSLGFTADQQVKYLGALRKKIENDALYANYDFGQGPAYQDLKGKWQPGENGTADIFGPNRPGAPPPKKTDPEALKQLEEERKKIAEILKNRKEEKEVIEMKLKGYDDLRIKYEQEQAFIKSSTLGTKEKAAALQKLSAEYNVIAQKTAFIKKQEEQKKAIEESKQFLEKARAQRQELEAELDGRVKLTKYLALEVEYKRMLAEGNKGSKEAQKNIEDAGKELEQAKRAEAAEKSAKLLKDSQQGSEAYSKSIMDQAKGLQQLNEDMDMRLRGEEKFIQFAHTRQDLEDQTQEVLKQKYETLKKIQELEALSPNNISLANDRKAVEKEINDTLDVRNKALANINASQDQFLQQTKALEKQQEILESITGSTVKYKEKLDALDDALNRGWITTDQYNDTLKKLNKTQGETNKYAEKFADAVGNAFEGFIAGGESAQDVLKKLGKELAVFALRTAIIDPLKKKFVSLFSPPPITPQVPAGVGPLNAGYTGWNSSPIVHPGQGTYSPNSNVNPPMLPSNAQPQTSPALGFPWAGPTAPINYSQTNLVEAPTTNALLQDILIELRMRGGSPFGILGSLFGKGKDFLSGMYGGMFGGGNPWTSLTPGGGLPFAGPTGLAQYQPVRGFAKGGNYSAGMGPVKIGEMGEEWFYPGMNGFIMPNWITQLMQMMGGGSLSSLDAMNGYNPWTAHLSGGFGGPGSKYGGSSIGAFGRSPFGDGGGNPWTSHLMPGGGLGGGGFGPGKAPVSSFTHGMGGESTGGLISNKDHAYTMWNLMKGQYEEARMRQQNGTGGMGDWQINNIYNEMKRYENEYMNNGRSQSMFQQSQFAPQWEMYNETSRLDATGRAINIDQYLPDSLRGRNTGARWSGFQAYGVSGGGMGGEIGVVGGGGGGFDMPSNINTSNFNNSQGEVHYQNTGGGQIVQMNQNRDGSWSSGGFMNGPNNVGYNGGSHNGLYNNGDLRSAHDYGSYRDPLLRSGMGDHFAVASIRSREISYPGSMDGGPLNEIGNPQYDFRGEYPENRPEWERMPGGGYINRDGDTYYDANGKQGKFSLDRKEADIMRGASAMVMPGNVLPVQFADMMPVQLESTLKNLADGFSIVDGAKPNIMPSDFLKDWGMQLGGQFLERGMWKGDHSSFIDFFRQYMGSNWSNRRMQPWQIPGAMRLFGYATGGRYKANQPMAVGENGMEIMIPETAGKVVSNSQIRDAVSQGGGSAPQFIVNTYTEKPVKVTQKRTPRGMMAVIEDATDAVMQRPGRMSRRLRDMYGVAQQPTGKS